MLDLVWKLPARFIASGKRVHDIVLVVKCSYFNGRWHARRGVHAEQNAIHSALDRVRWRTLCLGYLCT